MFGHLLLKLDGQEGFTKLAAEILLVAHQRVLDDLLSNGGTALDLATLQVGVRRPKNGADIDARVPVEGGIFGGQHGTLHGLGNLVQRDLRAVLRVVPVGHGPQAGTVAVVQVRALGQGLEADPVMVRAVSAHQVGHLRSNDRHCTRQHGNERRHDNHEAQKPLGVDEQALGEGHSATHGTAHAPPPRRQAITQEVGGRVAR